MPGKKRFGSWLPTATRPTPSSGSSALDCTSSARMPYSSACLSGCRRPQIGSPLARHRGTAPGARSSCGDRPAASRRRRGPATGANSTMRTRSPLKSSVSVAAIARNVPAAVSWRISASVSCCVRTARRSFSCALRTVPATGATARGSCRAALRAGSSPATRPDPPRAAPPCSPRGPGTAEEFRMPAQPGGDFVRAEFFAALAVQIAHCSHSPSKTNAAGPAIVIGESSSGQAIAQFAAGQRHGDVAIDAAAPHQHRRRGAGAAAAGQGFADAALVDAQADAIARDDLGETDVAPIAGTRRAACRRGPVHATGAVRDIVDLDHERAGCPSTPRRSGPARHRGRARIRRARRRIRVSGMACGANCGTPIAIA